MLRKVYLILSFNPIRGKYSQELVPPKVQGRRRNRNEVKPLSGLNVEALLGGDQKKAKVSAQNAIPDFKRLLDSAESIDALRDAAQQLGKIIEGRIKDSFGNIAYARALDEIKTLREEMTEMEEPALFNDFARQLKRKLLAEELGGNRKDFWWEFRKSKLGLVDKKATETSDATEEDAKSVSYEPLPPLSCQTTTDLISSGH